MYSMPSNYCPSPIRLMPGCPMVPSSPMTGLQTFYITMPSDAAAAMFFDPNLAAVQQHQTLMMQHAAHQTSMPPYRHIQQHHQMIVGNNSTDSSMPHHSFQAPPSAFFMAASAPPSSPGGAFFQQQLASPLPFYMRPNGQTINQTQMMPGKMGTSTTTVPMSAPSPLTVITTSTASASNASSPPPSSTTYATITTTSSGSNEQAINSDNSNTKRLSPIPCTLLEDEAMIKPQRSVTSKAITTLTGKLTDLLRACKYSLI